MVPAELADVLAPFAQLAEKMGTVRHPDRGRQDLIR